MKLSPTMRSVLIALGLFILIWFTIFVLTGGDRHHRKTVGVGKDDLIVWVAENQEAWTQGLSGTEIETLEADGMLFVFPDEQIRNFWMQGMNYSLDVVWIANGKIVKISEDVPMPVGEENIPHMSSDPFEIDQVLEVPSGMVSAQGWQGGDLVVIN